MLAIADQPVEPSAWASASNSAERGRDVDLEPTELLRHHRPEQLGVGDGLHGRRGGGRRGLGRVGLGFDDGRDPSRAVDDLVVDERSHGRERTERRDAAPRGRRRLAHHEQHDREHAEGHAGHHQRDAAEVGVVRRRRDHRPPARHRARRLRHAAGQLDAGPHPQPAERGTGDPLLDRGDVDPLVREVRHQLLIVGDPEVEPRGGRRSRRPSSCVENVDGVTRRAGTRAADPCAPLSSRTIAVDLLGTGERLGDGQDRATAARRPPRRDRPAGPGQVVEPHPVASVAATDLGRRARRPASSTTRTATDARAVVVHPHGDGRVGLARRERPTSTSATDRASIGTHPAPYAAPRRPRDPASIVRRPCRTGSTDDGRPGHEAAPAPGAGAVRRSVPGASPRSSRRAPSAEARDPRWRGRRSRPPRRPR